MPSARPASIDLLAWPAVHEAQLRVEDAHDRYAEAQRRCRLAPHGQVIPRRKALEKALREALEAEAALAALTKANLH